MDRPAVPSAAANNSPLNRPLVGAIAVDGPAVADGPYSTNAGGLTVTSPTANAVGSPRSKLAHRVENADNLDHGVRAGAKGSTQSQGGANSQRGSTGSRRGVNNGGRRNMERGAYDVYRGPVVGQDLHIPQQWPPLGVPQVPFMQFLPSPTAPPPLPASPYIMMPQHVRSFSRPTMYFDMPSLPPHMYYVAPPPPHFVAPTPPLFFYNQDDDLRSKLLNQIEYYFSTDNLCKDVFLRRKMDEQGWVPVSLIATFKKVKVITQSVPFIVEMLQGSSVVEVQGEKVRRRNDWMTWVLPQSSNYSSTPSTPNPSSPSGLEISSLTNLVRAVSFEENVNSNSTMSQAREKVVGMSTKGSMQFQGQNMANNRIGGTPNMML